MNLTYAKLIQGFEDWLKNALPILAPIYYTPDGPPHDSEGELSFEDFAVDTYFTLLGLDNDESPSA